MDKILAVVNCSSRFNKSVYSFTELWTIFSKNFQLFQLSLFELDSEVGRVCFLDLLIFFSKVTVVVHFGYLTKVGLF